VARQRRTPRNKCPFDEFEKLIDEGIDSWDLAAEAYADSLPWSRIKLEQDALRVEELEAEWNYVIQFGPPPPGGY
jgi:hypothetical protein